LNDTRSARAVKRPSLAVIARSYGSKGLMTLPDGVDIDDLLDGGGDGR